MAKGRKSKRYGGASARGAPEPAAPGAVREGALWGALAGALGTGIYWLGLIAGLIVLQVALLAAGAAPGSGLSGGVALLGITDVSTTLCLAAFAYVGGGAAVGAGAGAALTSLLPPLRPRVTRVGAIVIGSALGLLMAGAVRLAAPEGLGFGVEFVAIPVCAWIGWKVYPQAPLATTVDGTPIGEQPARSAARPGKPAAQSPRRRRGKPRERR